MSNDREVFVGASTGTMNPGHAIPVSILIVDDEPKNLTVLETVLDDPSYKLVRASSADEALLALISDEFALLILDIHMPGMSGFELAQIIKERKKTAHLPIIFLTAFYNEDQHMLEGYSTGAVDYLHKPVNPIVLRSKVAVFVELYRKNREWSVANAALLSEIKERVRVEERLRDLNNTLEHRVSERTAELRQNQIRLRRAAQAAMLTYLECDFSSRTVRIADNYESVMGYSPASLFLNDLASASDLILDHVVEADKQQLKSQFCGFIRGVSSNRAEYRVLGDDGVERCIESQWSIETNAGGDVSKIWVTNLDVTTIKRSQEAHRVSEARLRLALDSAELGSWQIQPATGEVTCDDRFRTILNVSKEFLRIREILEGIHPEDRARVIEAYRLAKTHNVHHALEAEFRVQLGNGKSRWIYAKGRANYSDRGWDRRIVSWDGTVSDVTSRKETEERLRRANQDLEQFAYSASHDLQEPLRNVAIYSRLLKERCGHLLESEAGMYLRFISEGATRTSSLVSGLLAYTRATNSDTVAFTETHSGEVLNQVLKNLEASISATRATINYSSLPSVAVHPVHLELVLQNLISNALKYAKDDEPPRIVISGIRQDVACRFSIQDNGIGIPQEFHKQIFGLFKRLSPSREKYPGTGIGLAISARVVERYGGRIWVESAPDNGATFHFTLPAAAQASAGTVGSD